jgi:hypothetical protein
LPAVAVLNGSVDIIDDQRFARERGVGTRRDSDEVKPYVIYLFDLDGMLTISQHWTLIPLSQVFWGVVVRRGLVRKLVVYTNLENLRRCRRGGEPENPEFGSVKAEVE